MKQAQNTLLSLPARLYRNFPADYARAVPAEGFGGWLTLPVELPLAETALVSMHAWNCYTPAAAPTLHRSEEYLPRARIVLEQVFPPLLAAARDAHLTVLHVVGGGDYYGACPGYRRAVALAGAAPATPRTAPASERTHLLRRRLADLGYPGAGFEEGLARDGTRIDFASQARPRDDEGVAENAVQLDALCRERGISHLVYIGFALNWCLLMSPGGMGEMHQRGYFCSVIRDATTAVENRESARAETHKEEGLWRVSTGFGLIFDAADLIAALRGTPSCA